MAQALIRATTRSSWPGSSRPSTPSAARKTWMRATNPRIKSGDAHDGGENSITSAVTLRNPPRPAIRLVVDEGRELLRRAAHGIVAGARGFFSQRGIGQNAHDLGVELVDDRRRRAARGDEAE